jgi:hypothetical protein
VADHSGDTGMWVGASSALSAALILAAKYGVPFLKLVLRVAMKRDEAATVPQLPQCPPTGQRPPTPRDFRGASEIAVLGERVSHLMSTVNTLVGSTQKLADGLNEVDRRQREMHGNFVTALNSLRMQQGMLQEAIDRNTATNDKLVEVLAQLAAERR